MNAADVTWTTAASDESGGQVQLEYVAGAPRQAVQVLALTGHYAIIAEGDDLLICPRIEGGDAIGGRTPRDGSWPGGEPQPLDAGIIGRTRLSGNVSWGAHIRIRGRAIDVFADDVTFRPQAGGGITAVVARDGDTVNPGTTPGTGMTTWMAGVSAFCGLTPPTDFGTVVGSSDVLEST
jgi:hypothetical protein